jgi:hypothetical protein
VPTAFSCANKKPSGIAIRERNSASGFNGRFISSFTFLDRKRTRRFEPQMNADLRRYFVSIPRLWVGTKRKAEFVAPPMSKSATPFTELSG